ncbi:MAG TPA: beta-galactosidase trimerization domain-containing protein [Pirellulales bacterium]|nr:beta-galactosidase trimerization domain-containing protein [Pirellulales bacterium]
MIRQLPIKARYPLALVLLAASGMASAADPYLEYVSTAPEFQRVRQDRDFLLGRWDTWLYMPWRYQWTIGTGDEGGQFCRDYGLLGGFTDHGSGPFEWLDQWELRFYNDHTAAKGFLHLRGAESKQNFAGFQRNGRAIRTGTDGPQPLDAALLARLRATVTDFVKNVKSHSTRCVAYALDDEISWGAFVTPLPWRINGDDGAYARWLRQYYGRDDAPPPEFVTPDFTRAQLSRPLGQLDFAPLLDRITYNDSAWANFVGDLVATANAADPDAPCGFVGGQSPNLWGGYDYAKLAKKIQFIEAYDLGSSAEIIRSFNPESAMPVVTTHFHSDERGTANDVWQAWHYFAHGNRGMIGWVDGWFDGPKPRPWLEEFRGTAKELSGVQGPKLAGARWLHDGVAIYYSHPSIQVSWCLDIEPHGGTWVNRGDDARLGTSHNVRKAWEYLLSDAGLQYNFLPYDEVLTRGVPDEYRVLILPACYALSDIEAVRIREFCERGGTVIADFACGLFDQHGRGRMAGALDDLFGVRHDGTETKADFFGGRLWVETDQDAAFSYRRYSELFATVDCKLVDGYAQAENDLGTQTSRQVGRGTAVYVNLSPQRYLQYREEKTATDETRTPFLRHIERAGVRPWLSVTAANGRRPENLEVTYWTKGDRTLLFVLQNATVTGSALGGGGAEGLVHQRTKLNVEFPADVDDVVNERTGERLGAGRRFAFDFNSVEAIFISFRGLRAAGAP